MERLPASLPIQKKSIPKKIEALGFSFEYDTIDDALVEILKGDHT